MNSVGRLILPLLAVTALAGCGESREAQLVRAQASYASHDFYAARSTANAALRDDPTNPELLLLLAQTQVRLKDAEGALITLERLKRLGAKASDLRTLSAEAEVLMGKHGLALAMLTGDGSADAWRIRAAARLGLGDQAGAADAFSRGMAARPEINLLADYAWFRLAHGDIDGAAAIAEKMQRIAADALETLLVSGEVESQRGQYDNALAVLRRAGKRYPAQARSAIAEGRVLELAGRLDQAGAAVRRAAEIAPGSPEVAALQIELAAAAGDWQNVRAILQPSESKLDPVSADGMLYAEAMLRLGYAEQARAQLQRAVLLRPANVNARRLLGQAQLQAGDAVGAAATLAPLTAGLLAQPQDLLLAERAARIAQRPEAERYRARLASHEYRRAVMDVTARCRAAAARPAAAAAAEPVPFFCRCRRRDCQPGDHNTGYYQIALHGSCPRLPMVDGIDRKLRARGWNMGVLMVNRHKALGNM